MELSKNCDEEIKKAFQKLVRFEKRVNKSLGALNNALEKEDKDVEFDRVKVLHDEAEKVFKNFVAQLNTSKDVFDDKCTTDDDDAIYDQLIRTHEIVNEEYAKSMSLYEKAKPAPPLSERTIRLQKNFGNSSLHQERLQFKLLKRTIFLNSIIYVWNSYWSTDAVQFTSISVYCHQHVVNFVRYRHHHIQDYIWTRWERRF